MLQHINALKQDAILWKAQRLYNPDASPHKKQEAVQSIAIMLSFIQSEVKRDSYIELIYNKLKIAKKHIRNTLQSLVEKQEDEASEGVKFKLPEWADKDRVTYYGIDWRINQKDNTGYYFVKQGGFMEQLTNFVLTPLFHLRDRQDNNRRLAVLHHGKLPDTLIELPTKSLISVDKFEEQLGNMGHYVTLESFGKPHLKRLNRAIGGDFKPAHELLYLGWQKDGFWSYSDAIYNGHSVQPFNQYGIAKYNDRYYFSPSASPLFSSDRKDEYGAEITENDPYENDKFLRYHKTEVRFEQWAKAVSEWMGEKAMPLVCYAFVSVFKDIITLNQKVPILYGYGIVQAGKSTWAEALIYLFYNKDYKALQLDTCTLYAFFNRAERNRNCPHLFNEFDEDKIEDEKFAGLKSFYDGEGRDRGSGIKGKAETQKWNCTVVLIGQTLTTKDGASVLSRCCPVRFDDPGERTEKETKYFQLFENWKNNGLNGCLVDILKYRNEFKAAFAGTFNNELAAMKQELISEGAPFKERIARNFCILLASGKVMMKYLNLGFPYESLFNWCKSNIIGLSNMINEVDNLATFWNIVAFLYERGDIQEGYDFKIEETTHVKIRSGKEEVTSSYDKPTKFIYVRLVKIYQLYAQNFRQTQGAKPINQKTLITYFESSKAFVGTNPASRFKGTGVTSSYVFKYESLGINLERPTDEDSSSDNRKPFHRTVTVSRPPVIIDAGGKEQIMFWVMYYEQQTAEGALPTTQTIYMKCFSTQIEFKDRLLTDTKVNIMGLVSEKHGKDGYVSRIIDVEQLQMDQPATNPFSPEAAEFF